MTHSQALAHAGGNDSQDSQAILEAYTAEFGVATLSSSPPKACFPVENNEDTIPLSLSDAEIDHSSSNAAARDALAAGSRRAGQAARRPAEVGDPPLWAGLAATGVALTSQKQYGSRKKAAAAAAPGVKENHVAASTNHANSNAPSESRSADFAQPSLPRHEPARPKQALDAALKRPNYGIKPPPPPVRRMEFSQQTPTQVNDDRDYSEYCDDVVPSSPVNGTTQPASNNPQTLDGDDAGVVNFGLSEIPRPSSQVSEDAGFENTRGDWRRPEETPQVGSSHAFTPFKPHDAAFETPALPKNPFAAKGSVAAPLAGSQLFGQSQFSSAVKKAVSPTSSRPSPNLFNSISPGIIETSPLKNRANVSSPTDIRTSSPLRLHEVPNTSLRDKDGEPDEVQTPLHSKSASGEMIPESPTSPDRTPRAIPPKSPPRSSDNGPKAHYIPMKKSQERKTHVEALVSPLDSDSDSDSAVRRLERKKKIERKRAQAAEEMGRVSFTPRARQGSGEPPSKKRRRVMSTGSTVMGPTAHETEEPSKSRDDSAPPILSTSQNVVAASNEAVPDGSTKATPGESTPDDKAELDDEGDTVMQMDMEKPTVEEDMIPATSPAPSMPETAPQDSAPPPPSEPDLPSLPDDVGGETKDEDDDPSSLPLQRRAMRTYGRDGRQRRRNPFISSSVNSDAITADQEPKPQPVSPAAESDVLSSPPPEEPPVESSVPKVDSPAKPKAPRRAPKRSPKKQQELPPPMTTRSRRSDTGPSTPLASRSAAEPMPTSSSLSLLSTTPVPSSKTTPATQESPLSERPGSVSLPSPAKARGPRKRGAGGTKSESPQAVARATRMAKRMPRLDSESTDELHNSPSASALEKSLIYTKSNRSFRQSIGQVQRSGRLFEGMVFAISFSSKFKPQERTKLETKITQAGGTILPEGFQPMFEQSLIMNTTTPIMDDEEPLTLTRASAECGFTALLGDSHSRKAKYMQALALGLPCLAHQWITTCLNKGAIVDWEPYVLCAGVSAVLGDAIRSRMLTPYSAAEARLADVVDERPRLLDGQRILVVVDSRKARNEAKEPYIFLARVLGPSISRVFTVQQAREVLQEREKAGEPFDWLYIDKGTGTVDAVLGPTDAPLGKRRRKSAPVAQPTIGNIRVLDDELVIQSLILGRMVEKDEMHF